MFMVQFLFGMVLTGILAVFTGQLKFTGSLWQVPSLPELLESSNRTK